MTLADVYCHYNRARGMEVCSVVYVTIVDVFNKEAEEVGLWTH